jgi:hypothetical protein
MSRSTPNRRANLSEHLLLTAIAALIAFIFGAIWAALRESIAIQWALAAAVATLVAVFIAYLTPEGHAKRRALFQCGPLLLVAGVLLGIGYIIGQPAEASLDWYVEGQDGRLSLLRGKPLTVDYDKLGPDRLEIPVSIAALNTGERPLHDVTVEIRYPEGYRVIPQGKQRIDRHKSVLVYEHPLDELKVQGAAVFLSEPDKLVLRAKVRVDGFVMLGINQVPLDGQAQLVEYGPDVDVRRTSGPPSDSTRTIPLSVTLFSEGQRIVSRTLEVTVPEAFGVGIYFPNDVWSQPLSIHEQKLAEHAMHLGGKSRITGVTPDSAGRPHQIDYRMGTLGTARYQIIRVDGIPRRLIVDADGNGIRDYDLMTKPEGVDGALDSKFAYQQRVPLYPWTKDTVEDDENLKTVR